MHHPLILSLPHHFPCRLHNTLNSTMHHPPYNSTMLPPCTSHQTPTSSCHASPTNPVSPTSLPSPPRSLLPATSYHFFFPNAYTLRGPLSQALHLLAPCANDTSLPSRLPSLLSFLLPAPLTLSFWRRNSTLDTLGWWF